MTVEKKRLSMKEKLLKSIIVIGIPLLLITTVFGQATLTKVNREVESIKREINAQKKSNESLIMRRDELLSFDKIDSIAKEAGLAYNNNNIKTVEE